MDWVIERWEEYPDLHIYHYAPYEPSAMKRLMGRHATREAEVDRDAAGRPVRRPLPGGEGRLARQRGELLDQGVGEILRIHQEVPLAEANSALYGVCAPLELGSPEAIKEEHKTAVEGYNRDDCVSTVQLRNWLEDIRQELVDGGAAIERPAPGEGQASDQLTEWQQMIQALGERIAGDVPIPPEDRNPEQQARWVLANILDWHRREEKAVWWEFFRLSDCSVEELIDERGALAQLEFIGEAGGTGRRPIHRYRFPVQETSLRGGEELRMPGGDRLGKLVSLDPQAGTVDIDKPAASPTPIPKRCSPTTWFRPTRTNRPWCASASTWLAAVSPGRALTERRGPCSCAKRRD